MARALLTACFVAVLAASAAADKVQLTDGRTLVGVATVEGDTVQIVMEYGTLRVPRAEVAAIEFGDTPEMELAKKVAAAPESNAAALGDIAKWAADNNLPRQATELYNKVLLLDPNHAAARSALDFVRVDGEWRTYPQALELARNKLEAGQSQALLADVLPALGPLAHSKERQQALAEIAGLALICTAKLPEAAKTFEDLAARSLPPAAVRYAAIAEVLKESLDGMYILAEPYPPAAELLGGQEAFLKAGPASLTDPRVLQAALADRAKKDIQAARAAIEELKKAGDPDAAKVKGAAAGRALDRAEALAPGIARSYRVELVRLRVEALRGQIVLQGRDFDKEKAGLWDKNDRLAPDYRAKAQKLMSLLDAIRDDLKDILDAANAYPRDLLLEVKWAESDLKTIRDRRDELMSALDGKK